MLRSRRTMNALHEQLLICARAGVLPPSLSCEEIIHQLAGELSLHDPDMGSDIVASALAREAEESTYIGRGLAVPHARLAGLDAPRVCLAAADGVDWHGCSATLVALLVVPENRPEWQLRLLGGLARYVSAHRNDPVLNLQDLAAALRSLS